MPEAERKSMDEVRLAIEVVRPTGKQLRKLVDGLDLMLELRSGDTVFNYCPSCASRGPSGRPCLTSVPLPYSPEPVVSTARRA